MPKDPIIESHIAESRAKIEKAAPERVEAERHIDRTQQALARSRKLLESLRDPLRFVRHIGGIASRAIADRRGVAPEKRQMSRAKAKAKPRR